MLVKIARNTIGQKRANPQKCPTGGFAAAAISVYVFLLNPNSLEQLPLFYEILTEKCYQTSQAKCSIVSDNQ